MICYLCSGKEFLQRPGSVRDNKDLKILECAQCGLVQLNSHGHLKANHYENSRMHGDDPPPIDFMLHDSNDDDERRFKLLKPFLIKKRILDFGCGNAGFLMRAKELASETLGVEPELRVREYWNSKIKIYPVLPTEVERMDLITAFHVIEHLSDPIKILKDLGSLLSDTGTMVIEVPSSSDALLTLYECEAFQNFTYWSQHLFLFNAHTLEVMISKAGLRVISIKQHQRYSLSNHLYWLSRGKPGGHRLWRFLDSDLLNTSYANALASIGKCDTLIAYLKLK